MTHEGEQSTANSAERFLAAKRMHPDKSELELQRYSRRREYFTGRLLDDFFFIGGRIDGDVNEEAGNLVKYIPEWQSQTLTEVNDEYEIVGLRKADPALDIEIINSMSIDDLCYVAQRNLSFTTRLRDDALADGMSEVEFSQAIKRWQSIVEISKRAQEISIDRSGNFSEKPSKEVSPSLDDIYREFYDEEKSPYIAKLFRRIFARRQMTEKGRRKHIRKFPQSFLKRAVDLESKLKKKGRDEEAEVVASLTLEDALHYAQQARDVFLIAKGGDSVLSDFDRVRTSNALDMWENIYYVVSHAISVQDSQSASS